MDLFGEHSVQVVTAIAAATLEAALVLTLATLLVLLSVRIARQSALRPVLAIVPRRAMRIALPGQDADVPSARWLSHSLPARAPPPDDPHVPPIYRRGRERFRPCPPGVINFRS